MDLFIDITAADKQQAAVVSVTDLTPIDSIPQLVLGDSEPYVIKFTSPAGVPAWAGDASYSLELALGELDGNGLLDYTRQLSFDPISGGWSGRLNLATQALIDAIALQTGASINWTRYPIDARIPRARPMLGWFFLQVRVVDPAGNKVTYAELRQPLLNRVLKGDPVENDSFAGAIEQTLTPDDDGDVSWDIRKGPWGVITLTDAANFLNPTNRNPNQILILEVRQSGGIAPTFGDQFIWPLPDSTPPVPAGLRQIYSFACTDDGKMLASMIDFAA